MIQPRTFPFLRDFSVFVSILAIFFSAGCAGSKATRASHGATASLHRYVDTGTACWYGEKFQGKKTASGEKFDMNAMTAAHRTLPFGTKVRITNLENHTSVVVRINDRGPFSKGRIIDVSHKAAQLLGFANAGLARVRIESLP
ncbi:MAG: septal ring lytic transglycosylase RlpA family protein [Candidatus Omnitrophica bacterium]|nr:septal ring lytic transglycosylase RlpA family protein [Candidatus Omnitrophota bacterium]